MRKKTHTFDAGRLSAEAHEDLRRRAVRAIVKAGKSASETARTFGVSQMLVSQWMKTSREKGFCGRKSKPHGRPKRSLLAGHKAATCVRLITHNTPDQLVAVCPVAPRDRRTTFGRVVLACIRLFFLPGYSPERNPDEYLNQDVKTNAVGREPPHNKQEMAKLVRSSLRNTQKQPEIIQSYFHHHAAR